MKSAERPCTDTDRIAWLMEHQLTLTPVIFTTDNERNTRGWGVYDSCSGRIASAVSLRAAIDLAMEKLK